MDFEEEILGPSYRDLDFNEYERLYAHVLSCEPRAALELNFLSSADQADVDDNESEDEEAEHEATGSPDAPDSAGSEGDKDMMEIDEKDDVGQQLATPSSSTRDQELPSASKPQQQESSSQPPTSGFPDGLEHYFAVYIWVLIYSQNYQEAASIGKRYENSLLFQVSPVVTASVRSAQRFVTPTLNDTTDYASIYQQVSSFSWSDSKRGGSSDLSRLVEAAVSVFHNKVYDQIRNKFSKVKASTVAKYLPLKIENSEGSTGTNINTTQVLEALNGVEEGWTIDSTDPELLVPPPALTTTEEKGSSISRETRKKWLDQLVSAASELERKSTVD